jgi:putative N6-adenine-specific DNA methylase
LRLFATAAKGTEAALRDELIELGFRGVRADRGGVHFDGPRREGYRACLWSRIAVRVLEPVTSFDCAGQAALYEGVAAHDFSDVLSPSHTLAVSAASRSSELSHTQYVAQRTKDAIVDRLRERFGERPDVERADPDVHVFVHLADDFATVYLDHAGAPLHQRGYRKGLAEAPLKETLAAAVLRLAGFEAEGPALDPMCGSGTVAIEAALLATKADLREEIDRLNGHVAAARELLSSGVPVGRKLDFLAQEFNRESNTICSKSNASAVTAAGIELKVVIDQFREQVQNLE